MSIYIIDGPDRDYLMEIAPLRAALFLVSPILALCVSAGALALAAMGYDAPRLRCFGAAALISSSVFLITSGIALDPAHPMILGAAVPKFGLFLTMLSSAGLLALGFFEDDVRRLVDKNLPSASFG